MKKTKFMSWMFCWIFGLVFIFLGGFFGFTQEGLKILNAGDVGFLNNPLTFVDSLLVGYKSFYATLIDTQSLIRFIVVVCIAALLLIVVVAQIVSYASCKSKKMLWWLIVTILVCGITTWLTGYIVYVANDMGGFRAAAQELVNWLAFKNSGVGIYISIFIYLIIIGLILFYIATIVILVKTFVYCHRFNKYYKESMENEEDPDALSYEGEEPGMQMPGMGNTNNINTIGNSSPLIVQYINSYGAETQFGGKPVNGQQSAQGPWWANQQMPEKPLTKEDVKEIIAELKKDSSPEEVEISYKNAEGEELEYVDLDDLRGLLREEVENILETELSKPQVEEKQVEEVKEPVAPVEETVGYKEIESAKEEVVQQVSQTNVPETRVELTTPVVVAMPAKIEEEKPVEQEETLTEEDIRGLISSEILSALKDFPKPKTKVVHKVITKEVPVEVVKEVPVEVVKEVKVEAPKKEEVKEEKPVILEEKPAEPQPIVKKEPVAPVKRGQEKAVEKGEVVRLNFLERIAEGDQILKDNYNAIKGLLMSYGLKNRLSNTGDTFRLHKKTYAKITCNGDSLKLYLALDPKELINTTALPVQDVSNKEAYKDIPLAFKVRSELSLRRANELIASCMRIDNLEANPDFEKLDYTKEIVTELENAKKVEAAIAKNKKN